MPTRLCKGAVLIIFLITLAGCTAALEQKENRPGFDYTKEDIQKFLATEEEVFAITWSPDGTGVVYIKEDKAEQEGLKKAYLWKAGEEKTRLIREVSRTTHSFNWSPDSQYFLISEKLEDGSVSSIVRADTLVEEEYKIKSTSLPVWSPDSLTLAFSAEQHDYGESWGSLEVYTLGAKQSEYIWKAKNYLYQVEFWDEEGNIGYTEIHDGKETKQTTQNIRPDIAGVHLGDTKDQVRAALGTDYEETPPGEEIGHFPEQVFRWAYDEGFVVFIGAESGKVLEITATSPQAATNLGIKVGDRAEQVFAAYRPKYIEPESIHGGKLFGIFKVEGAAALFFVFDLPEGQFPRDIRPESKVVRMILTYPGQLDDSF
ncbi:MAG: hypothetical protein ACOWWO_08710 [Peptococcaceae bacterium]